MGDYKIAASIMNDCKLGTSQVDKIYLGTELLWSKLTYGEDINYIGSTSTQQNNNTTISFSLDIGQSATFLIVPIHALWSHVVQSIPNLGDIVVTYGGVNMILTIGDSSSQTQVFILQNPPKGNNNVTITNYTCGRTMQSKPSWYSSVSPIRVKNTNYFSVLNINGLASNYTDTEKETVVVCGNLQYVSTLIQSITSNITIPQNATINSSYSSFLAIDINKSTSKSIYFNSDRSLDWYLYIISLTTYQ